MSRAILSEDEESIPSNQAQSIDNLVIAPMNKKMRKAFTIEYKSIRSIFSTKK